MDELEHEEPEAESYLSNEANTLEKPTTPPKRKAVFTAVFRTVLGPGIMILAALLVYFLIYTATNDEPASPLRLVANFLLWLFGAIGVVWLAIGLLVLLIKLAKRQKKDQEGTTRPDGPEKTVESSKLAPKKKFKKK